MDNLTAAPHLDRFPREVVHCPDRLVVWTEIPWAGKALRIFTQADGELEIPVERIENVLPRPRRFGIAQDNRCPLLQRRNGVRITRSADRSPPPITFPARVLARPKAFARRHERVAVRAERQFGTGFEAE